MKKTLLFICSVLVCCSFFACKKMNQNKLMATTWELVPINKTDSIYSEEWIFTENSLQVNRTCRLSDSTGCAVGNETSSGAYQMESASEFIVSGMVSQKEHVLDLARYNLTWQIVDVSKKVLILNGSGTVTDGKDSDGEAKVSDVFMMKEFLKKE